MDDDVARPATGQHIIFADDRWANVRGLAVGDQRQHVAGLGRETVGVAPGFAGVYREKASGARADRQPGEVVVAEKIDRISRLPLAEVERLVASMRDKGARLAVPGVVDLSELAASADGVSRIVLAKSAGEYKGRRADPNLRQLVIDLGGDGLSIATTGEENMCAFRSHLAMQSSMS